MLLTKSLNDQLMIMAAHRYCLTISRETEYIGCGCRKPVHNLAIAAHGYCLGRQTYMVEACIEWLLDNWSKLSRAVQQDIIRLTVIALKENKAGGACDIEAWRLFLQKIGVVKDAIITTEPNFYREGVAALNYAWLWSHWRQYGANTKFVLIRDTIEEIIGDKLNKQTLWLWQRFVKKGWTYLEEESKEKIIRAISSLYGGGVNASKHYAWYRQLIGEKGCPNATQ